MKKASDVFKSIRFAKGEPRGKPHLSTDDEEHGAVGEKEFNQQVQHVKKRAMQEEKKDKYDEGEYDQEGDMAKSDLRSIIANAQKLHDMIDDADNLPEWVQSKITVAEDYMSTVANYMTAEMSEAVKIPKTAHERFKERMKKAGYDMDAGAKRLQDLLDRQKKEREENEKNMKEETELNEAKKKPNATTRHLRQYPVSDKDVAKPVKKKEEKKVAEEIEYLEEKNAPTNPELWARAKSMARSKFDVYPSAYANGWAAKWYKSKGGGWKSVSEAKENPPFDPPYKTVKKVVDKSGAVHGPMSIAKHLAKTAAKKQEKSKKTMEESRQTEIVREASHKAKQKMKTKSNEKYEAEPELGVKRSDTNTMT
jgi:hypothetical protein